MTAILTNRELLQRSLDLLADGLVHTVEPAMRKRYNCHEGDWVTAVRRKFSREADGVQYQAADLQFLLKCLNWHWEKDFKQLGWKARGWVNFLTETRNEFIAHREAGSDDTSADEAQERVTYALRLLETVERPEAQTAYQNLMELKRRAAQEHFQPGIAPSSQHAGGGADLLSEAPAPESAVVEESSPGQSAVPPSDVTAQIAAFEDRSHGTSVRLPVAVPAARPVPYPGNVPAAVSKDAKYTCGLDGFIRLRFHLGNREETLLTSDRHPRLVAMVRAANEAHGESAGVFYINEYGHVLVKAAGGTWYAGTYTEHLDFEFEKQIIGPRAPKDARPGDIWKGPHAGILYRLTADGRDIYYKRTVRPGVERKELLSDHADATIVTDVARPVKPQGGRLYINEACVLFTPVQRGRLLEYRYLGTINLEHWFPAPEMET